MFESLKNIFGKKDNAIVIGSPIEGEAVPISEVSDPTFGEEILGKGIAIKPSVGKVYAPCDATITIMFDTMHAISMMSDDGVEILIHIGLDTVALKGEHFTSHCKADQKVKAGDLLLEFDIEGITNAGYQVISPVVITNTMDLKEVKPFPGSVKPQDKILEIVK